MLEAAQLLALFALLAIPIITGVLFLIGFAVILGDALTRHPSRRY